MRLIDIAPFEKLDPVLRFSYAGKDGKRHTIIAPVEDIPTFGSRLAMPEYLQRAICDVDLLPKATQKTEETSLGYTEQSIEELDLSVRSYNCLMRANIHTLADLLAKSEEELMHIRNMGKISMTEIRGKLERMGLNLAEETKSGNIKA